MRPCYFDYQRERVFVRTRTLQENHGCHGAGKAERTLGLAATSNSVARNVPLRRNALTRRPNRSLARLAFDLRLTRSGIKRWVTRFTTAWHHCSGCGTRFLPGDYLRLEEFGHSLKSWAMYEYVTHRTSLANIADTIRQCFDMPVHRRRSLPLNSSSPRTTRGLTSGSWRSSWLEISSRDETEVHAESREGLYLVFTNLEEVVFLYRPSREGEFLHDLLKDQGIALQVLENPRSCMREGMDQPARLRFTFSDFLLGSPVTERLQAIGGTPHSRVGPIMRPAASSRNTTSTYTRLALRKTHCTSPPGHAGIRAKSR